MSTSSASLASGGSLPPGPAPPTLRRWRAAYYFLRMLFDPVDGMRALSQQHGRLVCLDDVLPFYQDKTTYLVVGAQYNEDVLGKTAIWRTGRWSPRGPRNSAQFRLGWGLTSINGPRHAYYRKLLSRPLRRASVDEMGDDIGRLVEEMVADWPVGRPVDLWQLIKAVMRTVAIALLFGNDQARGQPLAAMIDEYMDIHGKPWVVGCPVDKPGFPYRQLLRHAEALERCSLEFAHAKRGRFDECDLLGLVVNSLDERGRPPSDELIAGHVPILFGAAYETCQTALAWALFLTAQHPAVARDLVDEVTAALAGGPATLRRVAELPLLDRVFKESMRILPTVPHQMRVSLQDTTLGGLAVKERTRVFVSAYLTNRVPEIYSDPSRFDPERWTRIDPGPYEYLAFSAGPRLCPGYWFGMGLVKVTIAAVLNRFRIAFVPDARIDRRVTVAMAPRHGLPVTLHPRDHAWAAARVRGDIHDMVDLPAPARP